MDTTNLIAIGAALCGAAVTLGGVYLAHGLNKRRLSDKEQFRNWLTLFDRPAFRGRYSWKSKPKPFEETMSIMINAINTGDVRNRRGAQLTEICGKGKTQLRDAGLRAQMDEVVVRLLKVRGLVRVQMRGDPAGRDLASQIDTHRDWIISSMNQSWKRLGLRGLELPTQLKHYDNMYDE
jgi:hypothetical protein